jgi:hypothetical protein
MKTIQRTSRVLAAAVSVACMFPALPSSGAALSISASSCASFSSSSDGNGGLVITCNGSTPASNCTLNASPTTVQPTGGNVTLTSSCGAVSGWTKNSQPQGQTATSWNDSIPVNKSASNVSFSYSVTGANGSATATVVQLGTGSGSGTGTGTGTGTSITCAGFTSTHPIPISWGALKSGSVRVSTTNFSNNDIVVAYFTTPGVTSAGQFGAIQAAESQPPAISRTASLSLAPCSFDNSLGATGFFSKQSGSALVSGTTVTVPFQVGGSNTQYPVLQPNTTYYYNIKNTTGSGGNIFIELQKPPGL